MRRAHFGRCSRTGHQGISPGWIDVYTAKLSGQWLRLPSGSGPQLLCLDLAADPLRRIAETDETDNATSVAIRVSGNTVRRVDSGSVAEANHCCQRQVVASSSWTPKSDGLGWPSGMAAPATRTDDVPAIADGLVALHSSDPTTVYLSAMTRMGNPSVAGREQASTGSAR